MLLKTDMKHINGSIIYEASPTAYLASTHYYSLQSIAIEQENYNETLLCNYVAYNVLQHPTVQFNTLNNT